MANGILNGTDLKVYITASGGSASLIEYATNATIKAHKDGNTRRNS